MNNKKFIDLSFSDNALVIIAIWSFLILLLCSPDSYLYDVYMRNDSVSFFMCGRAWMNGLIPYIDFTDSKGPLLWLIFGIGYLIDNDSYVGVFWMTLPFLCVTLYYGYKISLLYLNNSRLSIISAMLLSFALFHPSYHLETRAETFCWPFLICSIYNVIKLQNCEMWPQSRNFAFFVLGICFACTLLIKFTMAIMVGGTVILAWIFETKVQKWKGFLYFVLGFLLFVFPFLIYMLLKGFFDAFINEYFLTTIKTINIDNEGLPFFADLKRVFYHGDKYNVGGGWIVVYLLFTALFCHYNGDETRNFKDIVKKYTPLFIGILFLLISMQHARWAHYYEPCSLISIFMITLLLKAMSNKAVKIISSSIAIPVFIFITFIYWNGSYRRSNFFTQCLDSDGYYAACSIASQLEKPRILSFGNDPDIGLFVNSLPACKYWVRQAGYTQEMEMQQMMIFKTHQADIVTVYRGQEMDNIAKEAGYEKYDVGYNFGYIIYSKPGLKISYKTPSKLQRLTKKNIFRD